MTEIVKSWTKLRPWTRHSTVLLVAGFCYVFIGLTLVQGSEVEYRRQALVVARAWMPLWAWGCVFIIAGVMTIISTRWPHWMETWGYMVLTGLSSMWATFYATGVALAGAPSSGWTGAFMWGMIAFLWWAISGLLNPERVATVVARGSR